MEAFEDYHEMWKSKSQQMSRIKLTKSVKRSNLLPKLQIQVENSAISLGAHISIQMLANQLKGNFSRNNQRNQSIIEQKIRIMKYSSRYL